MKKQIFISYRRDGGEFFGKILHDELTKRGYSVFFDVESMEAGAFNTQIYKIIDECSDFLLILPPHGLDRCYQAGDWVAQEIRYALNKKKNIIPIMMKNFTWPQKMPAGLEMLPYFEGETFASNVNEEHINATVNILCNKLIKARPHRIKRFLLPIVAGTVVLAAVGVFFIWRNNRNPLPPTETVAADEASTATVAVGEIVTEEMEFETSENAAYVSEAYLHGLFRTYVINRNFENEICFLYADYDSDGSYEAYAVTGEEAGFSHEDTPCYEKVTLYYIDSKGKITTAADLQTGYFGCEPYIKEKLLDTGTDLYLVWEWYAGGVWGNTTLYGVQDGEFYSPRCSGRFMEFHFDTDHYEALKDYPDQGHARDLFWFIYDDAKHEFVTIARTFWEDGSGQLRSLNTAPGLLVQNGSTVNIDYIEMVDGAVLEDLSTSDSGTDVTVGSGVSIGDFEEQLIGHKVGETFTIEVEVHETYFIEDLAGKTVQFQITINGIYK